MMVVERSRDLSRPQRQAAAPRPRKRFGSGLRSQIPPQPPTPLGCCGSPGWLRSAPEHDTPTPALTRRNTQPTRKPEIKLQRILCSESMHTQLLSLLVVWRIAAASDWLNCNICNITNPFRMFQPPFRSSTRHSPPSFHPDSPSPCCHSLPPSPSVNPSACAHQSFCWPCWPCPVNRLDSHRALARAAQPAAAWSPATPPAPSTSSARARASTTTPSPSPRPGGSTSARARDPSTTPGSGSTRQPPRGDGGRACQRGRCVRRPVGHVGHRHGPGAWQLHADRRGLQLGGGSVHCHHQLHRGRPIHRLRRQRDQQHPWRREQRRLFVGRAFLSRRRSSGRSQLARAASLTPAFGHHLEASGVELIDVDDSCGAQSVIEMVLTPGSYTIVVEGCDLDEGVYTITTSCAAVADAADTTTTAFDTTADTATSGTTAIPTTTASETTTAVAVVVEQPFETTTAAVGPSSNSDGSCPRNCGQAALGGGTCRPTGVCLSCSENRLRVNGRCVQSVACRARRIQSGSMAGDNCRCLDSHCHYCNRVVAGSVGTDFICSTVRASRPARRTSRRRASAYSSAGMRNPSPAGPAGSSGSTSPTAASAAQTTTRPLLPARHASTAPASTVSTASSATAVASSMGTGAIGRTATASKVLLSTTLGATPANAARHLRARPDRTSRAWRVSAPAASAATTASAAAMAWAARPAMPAATASTSVVGSA